MTYAAKADLRQTMRSRWMLRLFSSQSYQLLRTDSSAGPKLPSFLIYHTKREQLGHTVRYRSDAHTKRHITKLFVKGTMSRDFLSPVFSSNNLSWSQQACLGTISNFFSDIRIRNRLLVDKFTGKSSRNPQVRQFLQAQIACPQVVKVTYSRFLE